MKDEGELSIQSNRKEIQTRCLIFEPDWHLGLPWRKTPSFFLQIWTRSSISGMLGIREGTNSFTLSHFTGANYKRTSLWITVIPQCCLTIPLQTLQCMMWYSVESSPATQFPPHMVADSCSPLDIWGINSMVIAQGGLICRNPPSGNGWRCFHTFGHLVFFWVSFQFPCKWMPWVNPSFMLWRKRGGGRRWTKVQN